jgi:hypothetical protein
LRAGYSLAQLTTFPPGTITAVVGYCVDATHYQHAIVGATTGHGGGTLRAHRLVLELPPIVLHRANIEDHESNGMPSTLVGFGSPLLPGYIPALTSWYAATGADRQLR